jgi:hypothetical protein
MYLEKLHTRKSPRIPIPASPGISGMLHKGSVFKAQSMDAAPLIFVSSIFLHFICVSLSVSAPTSSSSKSVPTLNDIHMKANSEGNWACLVFMK